MLVRNKPANSYDARKVWDIDCHTTILQMVWASIKFFAGPFCGICLGLAFLWVVAVLPYLTTWINDGDYPAGRPAGHYPDQTPVWFYVVASFFFGGLLLIMLNGLAQHLRASKALRLASD